MPTETLKLPEGLLANITEYLKQRPFVEVARLMQGLSYVEPVIDEDTAPSYDTQS